VVAFVFFFMQFPLIKLEDFFTEVTRKNNFVDFFRTDENVN
jgi:hypothetical protein